MHHDSLGPRQWMLLLFPLLSLVVALVCHKASVLVLLTLVLLSTLLYRGRGGRRKLLAWGSVLLIFVLLGALPVAIVSVEGTDALYSIGAWGITRTSLSACILLVLRAMSAILSMQILLQSFPIYMLCSLMRRAHLPALLVDLLELTYRYINVLGESASQIHLAQVSRLGYRGYQASMEHSATLVAQTFVLGMSQSEQLYDGLLSRYFDESGEESRSFSSNSLSMEIQSPTLSLIDLRSITYRYPNGSEALAGIDLILQPGERVVLLGANGAGKSTLLRILAGLRISSSGTYLYRGNTVGSSLRAQRELRAKVALVFQNSNHQLFTPTVEDEIAFGLRNMGLPKAEVRHRVEEIVAQYELDKLRHCAPHELSEGQKKWVAIASVLALRPEVVLLDEPTASLDYYYTERVAGLLRQLSEQGTAVLLSTHDILLAEQWATQAIVLRSGKVVAQGTVEEVFAQREVLKAAHVRQPVHELEQSKALEHRSSTPNLRNYPTATYTLPLYLNPEALPLLIIGGGKGVYRKLQALVRRAIPVTLLTPQVCPEIEVMLEEYSSTLRWQRAAYSEAYDLSSYGIIVAGTGQTELDEAICLRAQAEGKLYNSLSDAGTGNFHFAYSREQAGISIAVHTDYALPEVAQAVGERIFSGFDEGLTAELSELAQVRRELLHLKAAGEATSPEVLSKAQDRYETLKALFAARLG